MLPILIILMLIRFREIPILMPNYIIAQSNTARKQHNDKLTRRRKRRERSGASLRAQRSERSCRRSGAAPCSVACWFPSPTTNPSPEQARHNRRRPRQSTPATSDELTATSEPTERQKHNTQSNETSAANKPIENLREKRRNRNDQRTQPRQSTAAPDNKATATNKPDRNAARHATKPQRPENRTPAKRNADARDRTPSSPAAYSAPSVSLCIELSAL
jgi:hypothetical protein